MCTALREAFLAQSVERTALNRVVGGSSPPECDVFILFKVEIYFLKIVFSYDVINRKIGVAGLRSPCLPHAKGVLYQVSYNPKSIIPLQK